MINTTLPPAADNVSSVLESEIESVAPPHRARGGLPYSIISTLFALVDSAIIVGSGVAAGAAYQLAFTGSPQDIEVYAGLGLVACVTYALGGYHLGIYRLHHLLQRHRDYTRVLTSWCFAVLALTVVLFLFKVGAEVSRGSVLGLALLGGVSLIGWRRTATRGLHSAVVGGVIRGRRALLIGTPDELARLTRRDLLVSFGAEEIERVTLSATPAGSGAPTISASRHPEIDRAFERSRAVPLDEVLLAMPWSDGDGLDLVRQSSRMSPLPVRLLPDRAVSAVLGNDDATARQSFTVEIQRAPLSALERAAKRLMDVGVATAFSVILAPLMLVIAAAVRADSPGPIIFRQRRKGFNGREFVVFKFRTMTVLEDGTSIAQARRRDPRVTRLGRLLRRTSIDELPQLFNVLRGEMSIVGPRPHAVAHDDEYGKIIANYAFRHHVKPGMTGWAQVHGYRGETAQLHLMEKRVALDLWYINNWTIALDCRIIFRTIFELLRRPNAY
ncbi:undecaprenyl-phosphate glucose phosphotransferase [Rhodoplanes roseus]|uniref:Undecaprenyl-phosphate glucose phosphotransferase n=1 Tax=Rhodoplanes roseus TaxID=29409 RepID=A0A327KTI7_9BRAD|nr:undecaprenyl-phosphate glucose phosphotransferase [Rhodoplanes roseus]RAI42230.1 undecaprenyl-phosphate glucose phosphotransferase [Rhodoplanes roseus]